MGSFLFLIFRYGIGLDGAATDYQVLPILVSLDSIALALIMTMQKMNKS